MKIIIISVLCLFFIGISSYSFAQYTEPDWDIILPKVMLQLELRDSDGNFITYIEAEQIIAIYLLELNDFLDNQNNKEYLIEDNKAYEKIQWQGRTEKFTKQHAWSQFNLWSFVQDESIPVLTVRHNSYQSQPGDTVKVYWTIVRPVS